MIVTNMFPVQTLITEWRWYHYSTKDGKFQFDEFPAKGTDLNMLQRRWQHYREINHPSDTLIYRTFAINPSKFCLWRDYFTSARYKYPYINPATILKIEN